MKKNKILLALSISFIALSLTGVGLCFAGYTYVVKVADSSNNNVQISAKGSKYTFKLVLSSSDWYNVPSSKIYVNFSTSTTPTSSNSIYSYWTCNKTSNQVTLTYTMSNVSTSNRYLSVYRVDPSYELYSGGALNNSHIWNKTGNFDANSYISVENVMYYVTGTTNPYTISVS